MTLHVEIMKNFCHQVLGQCTGTLHPGWGEAVLVGCPPLTQKMEVKLHRLAFLNCSRCWRCPLSCRA